MITDMEKYIDIGVNLTGSSFKKDLESVVERAQAVGVERLIVTGTDVSHSEQAILLTEKFEGICYSTVGLHPHHASDYSTDVESELRDMLRHKNVVSVGECGLDFNRNYSTREQQIKAFEAQIEIAIDLKKPLFLHQRDAHDDFISILKSCRNDLCQVVVHCFTGTVEEANDYVLLDFFVGVTGWICDERRGHDLRQAVKHIPLNRLMLETDAPYLLPRDITEKPIKKGRNEPCFLPHITRSVAAVMEIEESAVAESAYKNTCEFFSFD
jgi:TatD DNase family protein